MRIAKHLLASAALFGFGASLLLAQQPESSNGPSKSGGLSQTQFEKLQKELRPPENELWRSIPWEVSLLAGRERAAKTRKPIFVWVASGEPLGCG